MAEFQSFLTWALMAEFQSFLTRALMGESKFFQSFLTWALMGVFSHKPLCCRTWKIFVILGTAKVPTLGGKSIVSAR